jgi:hypothetical protein
MFPDLGGLEQLFEERMGMRRQPEIGAKEITMTMAVRLGVMLALKEYRESSFPYRSFRAIRKTLLWPISLIKAMKDWKKGKEILEKEAEIKKNPLAKMLLGIIPGFPLSERLGWRLGAYLNGLLPKKHTA